MNIIIHIHSFIEPAETSDETRRRNESNEQLMYTDNQQSPILHIIILWMNIKWDEKKGESSSRWYKKKEKV